MKRFIAAVTGCLTVLLLAASSTVFAGVRLPAIFGDNMILQRNIKVPIWGWAEIGEKVEVTFMGKTYTTVTGRDGKWNLKLGTYKAGGPYEMTVASSSFKLGLKNILIGDVWLVTGQSNMEFGIQTEKHAADAIPKATDSEIHFFYVPMAKSLQQQYDIATTPQDSPNGKWVVCSPEIMANAKWAWHGFSAIGYYFAQQLRKSTGVPMGMIASYKGGTGAQAWISVEGLKQEPAFPKYVTRYQSLIDNYEDAKATYPQKLSAYQDSLKQWNIEVGNDFAITIKNWEAAVKQAKAAGQIPPVRPRPSHPAPRAPSEPDGGSNSPVNLYNAMILPVLHYGIKGCIWYQGESNADNIDEAVEYKQLFPRLIQDWRKNWGQGDFPFLFVQLPFHRDPSTSPAEGIWPWAREAQLSALSEPKTGMAVIIDMGDAVEIHPTNKLDVGNRLALVARRVAYGEKVVSSGPMYNSMKIEGNKAIITFDEVNKGLVAGNFSPDRVVPNPDELKGFAISGPDGNYVWAKAVINGNTVVVSSDQVSNPVEVRYDWGDNPPGNLYNKDGLPASPFRTDNWPPPTRILH
jgi:sialate O-acetylesterase